MKNGWKLWRLWSDFIRLFFTVIFFFSKKKRSISTVCRTVIWKFLENNNRMSKPYDWTTVRRTVIFYVWNWKKINRTTNRLTPKRFVVRLFFFKKILKKVTVRQTVLVSNGLSYGYLILFKFLKKQPYDKPFDTKTVRRTVYYFSRNF